MPLKNDVFFDCGDAGITNAQSAVVDDCRFEGAGDQRRCLFVLVVGRPLEHPQARFCA